MLIKEYRIPLPLSVEEYRIAQLYMIQKKSRQETRGEGSGVEILINEPYASGPGGTGGQYTRKIYHVGSHLPGWIRPILPRSALMVEEEAWNAYPYTKTRYTCPFVEKFSLEIETRYLSNGGQTENVFNLSSKEIKNREVDLVDMVNDQMWASDYLEAEDPVFYKSEKTGRGPLGQNWIAEAPTVMCAYKLCKVEFRYWGMQSKLEKFIHDVGLRKTMLRAHRQAWAWQDEWVGLTIADIRLLELEAQEELAERMREFARNEDADSSTPTRDRASSTSPRPSAPRINGVGGSGGALETPSPRLRRVSSDSAARYAAHRRSLEVDVEGLSWRMRAIAQDDDDDSIPSTGEDDLFFDAMEPDEPAVLPCGFEMSTSTSVEWLQIDAADDLVDGLSDGVADEAEGVDENDCLSPAQSFRTLDTISTTASFMSCPDDETIFDDDIDDDDDDDLDSPPTARRSTPKSYLRLTKEASLSLASSTASSSALSQQPPPNASPFPLPCKTAVLILVFHGGSVLDAGQDLTVKASDTGTFQSTLNRLLEIHYPAAHGHIAVRHVSCPSLCSDTLSALTRLNPFGLHCASPLANSFDPTVSCHDAIAIGVSPLLSMTKPDYDLLVDETVAAANEAFRSFLDSPDGAGFSGQVSVIGDCNGGLLAFDALLRRPEFIGGSLMSLEGPCSEFSDRNSLTSLDRRPSFEGASSSSAADSLGGGASKDASPPLSAGMGAVSFVGVSHKSAALTAGLQLPSTAGLRRGSTSSEAFALSGVVGGGVVGGGVVGVSRSGSAKPHLLFDASDLFLFGSPLALVLFYRQLVQGSRSVIHAGNFQVFNLFYPSDPSAIRLEPLLHDHFRDTPPVKVPRYQKFPLGDGASNQVNVPQWWGSQRIDFALYSPEALRNFPPAALPHLFHASYWESYDVTAFVIRQILKLDPLNESSVCTVTEDAVATDNLQPPKGPSFKPGQAREKWMRKRTTVKLKNVTANHRANDVICVENGDQILQGRFMYGPLDMVALTGEKVDVHIQSAPPTGDWVYFGMALTDSTGRIAFEVSPEKRLPQGMYPVKMVVRGDHTCVDFYLTVLPPGTECVVFSIDGSFTASVSIWGKDPKVRAGAIDVVRFWRDLGYLIIYITARPDMQKRKVVSWLAQHNFPHGMVVFMDGLSTDPLRQKLVFLQRLKDEAKIVIKAAYGSAKDIAVYQGVHIPPSGIFVVGKASKKQSNNANFISDGYASHLASLTDGDGDVNATKIKPKPAAGNTRLFVRKGYFNHLGGQPSVAAATVPTNTSIRLHRSISARRNKRDKSN